MVCAEVAVAGGLSVAQIVDSGVAYLRVSSTGPGEPMMLLLPVPSELPAGLSVVSQLGMLHARYWALVWGVGDPPVTGVAFTSGDLRFRREACCPAVAVGPAWVAVAEGVFRQATVDPEGSTPYWLPLAPSW
jgi:hypothetical protein